MELNKKKKTLTERCTFSSFYTPLGMNKRVFRHGITCPCLIYSDMGRFSSLFFLCIFRCCFSIYASIFYSL